MKKNYSSFCFFFLMIFMQALTAQSGTIVFTVKDNTTGYRLKSSNLVLQNNKSTPFSTDRKGQAYLTLEVGWYKFEFTSSGYKNHRTYFLVEEDKKLNVNIIMDSIEHSNPTVDESSNFILEGYIIDSLTGNPLKDVGVALPHFTMKTKTDETGYYRLSTKINHFSEVPYNEITKIDIEFSKNGLIVHKTKDFLVLPTLIRKNIELNLNGIETIESYAHGFNRTTEYSDINQEGTVILSNDIIEFLTPVSCNYNSTIRVGTSCSCTTCSTVQSMSIESYVQTGLDNEWISSWASNSLKAGAVAYRSYGAYYTVNPVNANFNIASSTCNQVWGSETAQTCINAATATSGEALEKNSTLFRSEYSAENNNSGCGNGYSGTGSAWPCISDNLCAGQAMSGHGRGMCQWGSKRWADQGQSYTWILDHYYNPGGVSRCGVAILPPGNDNCPGTPLTSSTSCSYTTGQTVINATASGKSKPSCDLYLGTASMLDVWYSFSAVSTSHSINVQPSASTTAGGIDAVVSVYNSCSATSPISGGCKDDSGTGSVTNFTVTGLTVGATYYIRVYDYGASIPTNGGFSICVTHTAQSCTTTLSPTSQSVSASSTSTTFNISLNPIVCVWSVSSNPCNLQLNPSSGGGGNVTVTYSANTTTTEKRCSIVINGQTFTLIQAAASCNYSISSTSQSFASAGGNGSFSLTTSTGCTWSASTNCNWVTVTNSSGSGSSVISYTVSANTSTSSRTCAITVNGQIYTVTQSGVSQACTYSFSPLGNTYTFEEQIGRLNVIVNSGCDWIATSNSSWIDVLTPNGSGNGEVSFKISKNTRANEQTGTVKISGRSPNSTYEGYFNVIQTGMPVCNYSINSSSQNFASTGGSGSFNLSTTTDCAWAASTDCNWVTLNSNSGSGTSTINYTVSTNALTTVRTCIITINGQTHAITQQGSNPSCTAPTNLVVSNITQTSATVTWVNGQNITDLQVGIKPTNSTVYNAYPMASISTTTFTIPQLICGTNYDVRVLSNCSTGSPVFVTMPFSTLPCNCSYTLGIPPNVGYAGHPITPLSFPITTTAACTWTVMPVANYPWLTNLTTSGTGQGQIMMNIAACDNTTNKQATLKVTGQNGYSENVNIIQICSNQPCNLQPPKIKLMGCELSVAPVNNVTYKWYYSGIPIQNNNTPFHVVDRSATYQCIITDNSNPSCTSPSQYFYATYNPCVDSKEIPELKKLVVYPNPNKGTFIIEFELQEMKDMGIKIYNAIGQQVYNRSRSKFIGKFKEQIDLRHLSAGIYLVTIEINDKKVVKNIVIE